MMIRNESPNDELAVHAVNAAAFKTSTEADLVDALRGQADPLVSLVAEMDDAVVGHIMFTPVSLTGHPELKIMGLAPMAVLPAHQRTGIGSAMVLAGLEACKKIGVVAAVVLGHPEFYPKFGFTPSKPFGIATEYKVPAEVFMVLELQPGSLAEKQGTIKYHSAFGSPAERNLGPQPIAKLMEEYKLQAHHLVSASKEQLTHKMVTKACKGRRLTPNVKSKVSKALNAASGKEHSVKDLFTY